MIERRARRKEKLRSSHTRDSLARNVPEVPFNVTFVTGLVLFVLYFIREVDDVQYAAN